MKTWKPRAYQKTAIKFLLGQAACGLFLDPGLGKTSTVLSAFKILKEKGLVKRMLVIAPLRPVYSVWPNEIKKWENFSGLTYSILHGKSKATRAGENTDVNIVNCDYPALQWLLEFSVLGNYDVLVIDESTKFKSSSSKRFKLLKKVLPKFTRRWILTGTPMPKSLEDLFSQVYILDGGRSLGAYVTHFRNHFMDTPNPYQPYHRVLKEGAYERVLDLIDPLILRLKAEDHLDMPELIVNDIFVELPPKARKAYENIENEFFTDLESGVIIAANAAVAGGKCRQIANGAVYLEDGSWNLTHDGKLEALQDLVECLQGKPLLLIYEWKHDIERIREAFGTVPSLSDAKGDEADLPIEHFNAGLIPILATHPLSGGHGLNLQEACSNVVFFGLTWDYELYDQVFRRIYRQGQSSKSVVIHRILAKDTQDERVARVLAQKGASQEALLAAITAPK